VTGTNEEAGAVSFDGEVQENCFFQRNSKLGLMPWRRATADTFRYPLEASATIARFSSSVRTRRVSATMSKCLDLSPDIPTEQSPA
jgi:hypothetical protein